MTHAMRKSPRSSTHFWQIPISFVWVILSLAIIRPEPADASFNQSDFCNSRDYQVVRLSNSPLQATSILELQRTQGDVKVIVDSDRLTPRDLQNIANTGAILIIHTATTRISPRDIQNIQRSSGNVGLFVNSNRISTSDLQNLAGDGVQLLIDVAATDLSASAIQTIQRSSGRVTLIVNSSRPGEQAINALIQDGIRISDSSGCAGA